FTFDDMGIGTGQAASEKVHRIGKSIFGERGEDCKGLSLVLDWLRRGAKNKDRPELPDDASFNLLELSPSGIYLWSEPLDRDLIAEPNFAIGSGAKVAMYCMRELKMSPLQAVKEAAKVDAFTKGPFIAERLRR